MSHHYSGPNLAFPGGDARLDFTDLYAFPKPGDPGKSILIMNVHPSAGVSPPPSPSRPKRCTSSRSTRTATLSPISRTRCASHLPTAGGRPPRCAEWRAHKPPRRAAAAGSWSKSAQVSTGRDAGVTEAGEHRFFAGWRSDPFFFDVQGVLNNFQFTGDDFFADKDICSIVLEVSNSVLGPKEVGLTARILIPAKGANGSWVQVDRGARPSQTPFLSGEQNEAYRAAEPANDARFVPLFAHALEHTAGYTPEAATRVAGTLLPDLLRYDPTRPASFPSNGRALTDDVADAFLAILTNGKVMGDKAGPHGDLIPQFPYLGPPHNAR